MKPWQQIIDRHYPSRKELETWIGSVWKLAKSAKCTSETLNDPSFQRPLGVWYLKDARYVRLSPVGMNSFYAFWQPALSETAPLLVHVPGYGAEMSAHPDLVALGYNVLHVCPLGYVTPKGDNESMKVNGNWPVLPDTITSGGKDGYRIWFANVLMAVEWAMRQPSVLPNRLSFFGTSQGGGTALILSSIFKGKGIRCVAADLPFLTNFALANGRGAYQVCWKEMKEMGARGWKSAGLVDTLSHAHRLEVPTLLTSGGVDEVCPPDTIESLYERLPGIKGLIHLKTTGHWYTKEFIPLASAWFRLYA
jgi:cephalosporin-C deacetylase-like acetyl esterase